VVRRLLRRPAVLMAAYVSLFASAGPWLSTGRAPHRSIVEFAVAVVLAVLAARGSRTARVLLIFYSSAGCLAILVGGTQNWVPIMTRLSLMACYVAQLALLLNNPMCERSRPGWASVQPAARWLPLPRTWVPLASAAAGLGITLLHLGNLRPIPCPADATTVLPHSQCLAAGYGEPFAIRWFGGYIQNLPDGMTHWLFVATPSGLQLAPFAADWAMWAVGILLAIDSIGLFLSCRDSSRVQYYASGPDSSEPVAALP
jgi:hypothetical protein